MPRPPLKLIEWEDAFNGNHRWHGLDDIPDKVEPWIVATVGFEIRRSAERVTLAMTYAGGDDDNEPTCMDLMTIPVGMIRKERVLR